MIYKTLAIVCACLLPTLGLASNTIVGDVVEHETNTPIEGVKIFISYQSDSKGELAAESDFEGNFTIDDVDSSKPYIFLIYEPPEDSEYASDARRFIRNNVVTKKVDTIGLPRPRKDKQSATYAASANQRYKEQGGDAERIE